MRRYRFYTLILFLAILSSLSWSYQWPMQNSEDNFVGPLSVTATLGDARNLGTVVQHHTYGA